MNSGYSLPSFLEGLQGERAEATSLVVDRNTAKFEITPRWPDDAGRPSFIHNPTFSQTGIDASLAVLLSMPVANAVSALKRSALAVVNAGSMWDVVWATKAYPLGLPRSCYGTHSDPYHVVVCLTSAPLFDITEGDGDCERVVRAVLNVGGDRAQRGGGVVVACAYAHDAIVQGVAAPHRCPQCPMKNVSWSS